MIAIRAISKLILNSMSELGINPNKCDFSICNNILETSESLDRALASAIVSPITTEEIEAIDNVVIMTIVDIFMTKHNIDITETEEEKKAMTRYENIDDKAPVDGINIYFKTIKNIPVLTAEEEKAMFLEYRNGKTEYKQLISERNQKLVVSIAKRKTDKNYDLLTAIQDGNLGLSRAIEDFDVTKGYKFSTYATWWIRQAIDREKAKNKYSYKIGLRVQDDLKKYNSFIIQYMMTYGTEPNYESISEGTGLSLERVIDLAKTPVAPISLNMPVIEEENETELMSFVADENCVSPEEKALNGTLRDELFKVMDKCLKSREKEIVIAYYGLNNDNPKTYDEIAQVYKITRTRVGQIHRNALGKMHYEARSLRLYM